MTMTIIITIKSVTFTYCEGNITINTDNIKYDSNGNAVGEGTIEFDELDHLVRTIGEISNS